MKYNTKPYCCQSILYILGNDIDNLSSQYFKHSCEKFFGLTQYDNESKMYCIRVVKTGCLKVLCHIHLQDTDFLVIVHKWIGAVVYRAKKVRKN